MKLIINEPIYYGQTYDLDISDKELDENFNLYNSIESIFNKFNIDSIVISMESGIEIKINPQKITLSDNDMNELFADAFSYIFEPTMKYAWLGGVGCEFAMIFSEVIVND